jgi:hypothetical protein
MAAQPDNSSSFLLQLDHGSGYGILRRRAHLEQSEIILAGKSNQLLGLLTGAEDREAGDAAAHHGNLVATVQTRTVLAILEDLVRQFGFVFDGAKTVLEKEIRETSKEADGLDAVLFGLFTMSDLRMLPPAPFPLAPGATTMERTSQRCGP